MTPKPPLWGIALLACSGIAWGAEFQNLDFEAAPQTLCETPQGDFGTVGKTSEWLPAWSFWIGDQPQENVGHNRATIDNLLTSLHDKRAFGPEYNRYPAPPYEGQFGFLFRSQVQNGLNTPSLRQTATVPAGTQTIRILVFGDPIRVYLGNQEIPVKYVLQPNERTTPPYLPLTHAIGNVAEFAGKEVELRIEPDYGNAIRTFAGIDSIEFLQEAIVVAEEVLVDRGDPIILRRLK